MSQREIPVVEFADSTGLAVLDSVSLGRYIVAFCFHGGLIRATNLIVITNKDHSKPTEYYVQDAKGRFDLSGCLGESLVECRLVEKGCPPSEGGGVYMTFASGSVIFIPGWDDNGEGGTIDYGKTTIVF